MLLVYGCKLLLFRLNTCSLSAEKYLFILIEFQCCCHVLCTILKSHAMKSVFPDINSELQNTSSLCNGDGGKGGVCSLNQECSLG